MKIKTSIINISKRNIFNISKRYINIYDDKYLCGKQPFNTQKDYKFNPLKKWRNNKKEKIIIPSYWNPEKTGINIDNYTIYCQDFFKSKNGLRDIFENNTINKEKQETQKLLNKMNHLYSEKGIIILRNTNLKKNNKGDINLMSQIPKLLFSKEHEKYIAGSNLRGYIENNLNIYDTGAPMDAHIHYHHEMQYVNSSPKNITFLALSVPNNKENGATFISYNPNVTEDIVKTETGEKLTQKGVCYIRKLPDIEHFKNKKLDQNIVYNFWQTSMNTHDKYKAEQIAISQGLKVEWEESPIFGRYMITKFYIDAFEYDKNMKKNQLFCSIADDWVWFDTWKGLSEIEPIHRPLSLEYGDNTKLTYEDKKILSKVYDNHGNKITWNEPGDILIICNQRFAHGRPPYHLEPGELRSLGVILGNRFQRIGQIKNY